MKNSQIYILISSAFTLSYCIMRNETGLIIIIAAGYGLSAIFSTVINGK